MAVLSFVEISEGKIKKASVEAAYYGSKTAEALGTDSVAVVLGEASADELATLGQVGVKKVLHATDAKLNHFDSRAYTKAVAAAVEASGADVVVLSFNHNGKLLAPRLSVKLKANYVGGAVELPQFNGAGAMGYRARIRNHGHSCFLCEIVIRSQFHTTYEPEA
jgi:Electron transfer flavoprotein, alpha subunit